jgi:hypothetical protein
MNATRAGWCAGASLLLLLAACDCGKGFIHPAPIPEGDLVLVLSTVMCYECECEEVVISGGCRPTAMALIGTWADRAHALDLQYSKECSAAVADLESDCPDPQTNRRVSCEDECQIYIGDAKGGEPCQIAGRRMSTCAQGLACGPDGICHSPCDVPTIAELGQPCGPTFGLYFTDCEQGTACSESGVCVLAQSLAAECGPESPCGTGLVCSPNSGQCEALLATGAECEENELCASRWCEQGVCAEDQPRYCTEVIW